MIKELTLLFSTAVILCFSGCTFTSSLSKQNNTPANNTTSPSPKASETAAKNDNPASKETPNKNDSSGDKSACLNAKMDGKRLIADQTFVFDYEPFPKSCFVTFASKEDMLDEKDVPRGSTFHIYKNGKLEYDFEDAFDGQPACWVEGVGFEDLNGDGDIDIIIAGSCLAAKSGYPVNAIYENYQDDFHTYPSQNAVLANFTTVKQIADYAKKNPKEFFNRR